MGANASQHESLGSDLRGEQKVSQSLFFPYGRGHSIRKSIRRRKEKRKTKDSQEHEANKDGSVPKVPTSNEVYDRKMDKLRRSFRDSFKKPKKDQHIPESSRPQTWLIDESSVRAGTCIFGVKYLGCVEVFESRGMQVCEEALKVLRNSRRRPLRGILYISGDGLRVVDDDTKGLLVDQTIEKVSFCAPDRNHERGFSYICRDGTTRRWMCHGFIAVKETGERLSHAVGCAFASCLERKQKRDKECGVTMNFDQTTSTFTRMGSFRQMSLTERLSDPQECKPLETQVPVKKVDNPHAIARPHATPQLLQRQGSFRVFNQLNQSSPFKRQLSLRLNELPSNLERTKGLSLDNAAVTENSSNVINNNTVHQQAPLVAPIPESSPLIDRKADPVSAMCQQVSAGLSLLSSFADPLSNNGMANPTSPDSLESTSANRNILSNVAPADMNGSGNSAQPNEPSLILEGGVNWNVASSQINESFPLGANLDFSSSMSKGEEWLSQFSSNEPSKINEKPFSSGKKMPPLSHLRSSSLGTAPSTSPTFGRPDLFSNVRLPTNPIQSFNIPAKSVTESGPARASGSNSNDPFDSDWVSLASRSSNPNNPFLENTATKAFEIKM